MSGGVDSSVAASLLMEQGYEVAGATMLLLPDDFERVDKTRAIAESLGIDFYVFDFIDDFKREIINDFAATYMRGETPNPCVLCNQKFKFGRFLRKALSLGYDYIATGHYASVSFDGRYHLKKSQNAKKDQSYFVYGLTQSELKHVVFPLENMADKDEIRAIAEANGLDNAKSKDSQDICFVKNGAYLDVVDKVAAELGMKRFPGIFVDTDGRILGENPGIERYTIGQRKGVGIALGGEKPSYVIAKDSEKHAVVMGDDSLLYKEKATVKNVTFTGGVEIGYEFEAEVKTRFAQKTIASKVVYNPERKIATVYFESPVRAITPGQYAVFYAGEEVLGGGVIVD